MNAFMSNKRIDYRCEDKIVEAIIKIAEKNKKYYIDIRGSHSRYKHHVDFYYHRSYAKGMFFETDQAYEIFIKKHPVVYLDYSVFANEVDYDIQKLSKRIYSQIHRGKKK